MYRQFIASEAGQDLVEYSLLLAVIMMIAASVLPFSTDAIAHICAKTEDNLKRAAGSQ